MLILGVDPGISGALAFWHTSFDRLVSVHDMPVANVRVGKSLKRRVVPALLADLIGAHKPVHAFVEDVHAMPRQGVSSMFVFGHSVGIVIGVLACLDVPITMVTPQEWQKVTKARGAISARARALQLFPEMAERFKMKKDEGRADAALIAYWGSTTLE